MKQDDIFQSKQRVLFIALDEVTRITHMPRKGTTVPFPAFPARD